MLVSIPTRSGQRWGSNPYLSAHPTAHTIRWGTGTGRRARTVGSLLAFTLHAHFSVAGIPEVPTARAWKANLAARGEVLALRENALVVVDVVLPAVLSLVDVREAGVDTCVTETLSDRLQFVIHAHPSPRYPNSDVIPLFVPNSFAMRPIRILDKESAESKR